MYLDAIKSMPKPDSKLHTEKGDAVHMKTDVFKRIIWYAYKGENGMVALTPERVAEIKKLNTDGIKRLFLEHKFGEPLYAREVKQ
jgi:hypothetical protein